MQFPDAPEFDSRPPQLNPTEYVAWCEEMMEMTPINRDDPEQRFLQKTGVEFVM